MPIRYTLVYIPGYKSTIHGSRKARFFAEYSMKKNIDLIMWDHPTHEQRVPQGTIASWTEHGLKEIERADGLLVIVGSSMGSWVGLKIMERMEHRVAGFLGIGSTDQFTLRILHSLSSAQKSELLTKGYVTRPSRYDPAGYAYSSELLSQSASLRVLRHTYQFPLEFLHGVRDTDVPIEDSLHLASQTGGQVLLLDGDHRCSSTRELQIIENRLDALLHLQKGLTA
jgi:predicted alpha/beta hydrolase family esterase